MKYRFALVLPILALAGCAALDQVAKDIQKATAPVKYAPYTRSAAKSIYAQIEAEHDPRGRLPAFIKVAPWFQGHAELKVSGSQLTVVLKRPTMRSKISSLRN